ncbi:MAG: hypothetical protein AAFO04_27030 [Cyanobacteria bacterium J06592_8]
MTQTTELHQHSSQQLVPTQDKLKSQLAEVMAELEELATQINQQREAYLEIQAAMLKFETSFGYCYQLELVEFDQTSRTLLGESLKIDSPSPMNEEEIQTFVKVFYPEKILCDWRDLQPKSLASIFNVL